MRVEWEMGASSGAGRTAFHVVTSERMLQWSDGAVRRLRPQCKRTNWTLLSTNTFARRILTLDYELLLGGAEFDGFLLFSIGH